MTSLSFLAKALYISDMVENADKQKRIKDAAQRALEEAEARKKEKQGKALPKEFGGRDGPEPTRFGDWEKDGIISDF